MRIGTLWCCLFGHKMVRPTDYYDKEGVYWRERERIDWCFRCGAKELELQILVPRGTA